MNRVCAAGLSVLLVVFGVATTAQTLSPDQQVYERFREWASQQQTEANRQTAQAAGAPDLLTRYREELRSRGVTASEIDRQIREIQEQGQRLEIERWNRILTNPKPTFNTEPNAFLVQIAKSRKPGTALDVGMGQGRNAIYLAQQGWTVTGFDPADQAVAAARDRANVSVRR